MKVLLLVLSLFALVGCGNSGGGSSKSKKTTKISESQIEEIMNNQNFDCASIDGNGCPEGIARLLMINKKNPEKSSVCSGFMVDSETLVTNEHCISNQKVCNDTYVAIYNGHGYERNRCRKVIRILNDYDDANDSRKKLDVAIVKLENNYYGSAFYPSRYSPFTGETVTAWVVDQIGIDSNKSILDVRITELRCKVAKKGKREALMLDDCPVVQGNSGSPILNTYGELVGVIWGSAAGDLDSSVSLYFRRNLSVQAAATDIMYFEKYL
jgi:V8-like Glu-specific endopeptidase